MSESLLPVDILPTIPDLYGQEGNKDPMIYARFHTKDDAYQWFLTEVSRQDLNTCFGYIASADGIEMGYFSLAILGQPDTPLLEFHDEEHSTVYQSEELRSEVFWDTTFTPHLWSVCKQEFEV